MSAQDADAQEAAAHEALAHEASDFALRAQLAYAVRQRRGGGPCAMPVSSMTSIETIFELGQRLPCP